MVQLTDQLVHLLDRHAVRKGMSRSALIRTVLEEFLENDRDALVSQEIVEGYTRIPPATPDEWGDLAQQTDQATVEMLQRLDAEERAAGHKPW